MAFEMNPPVFLEDSLKTPFIGLFLFASMLAIFAGLSVVWKWGIIATIGLIFLWSSFDFWVASFVLAGLIIAQGKVGILVHTPANVIIDDIILAEVFLPFFLCSFLLSNLNDRRTGRTWRKHIRETLLIIFIMLLWTLFAANFATWKIRALTQSFHILVGFIYLLAFSALSEKKVRFFLGAATFWGLVYFTLALLCVSGIKLELDSIELTKLFRLKLEFFSGGKRAALLSPPAVTSVTLGFCALSAYLMALLHRKYRIPLLVIAFLISVGVFYTRTRSEMVAFLFAAFTATALLTWKKDFLVRGLVLCLVYVLFIWAVAAGLDLTSAIRRMEAATDIGEQASLGIRLGLWKEGLMDLGRTYGLGVGTGGFFQYKDQWPHAHNVYFSVLFDLGIPGFFLWILVYLNIWRLLLCCLKKPGPNVEQWLLLVFAVAFYVELSLTSLLQHEYRTFIWWLAPGIILAIINIHLNKQPLRSEAYDLHK